MKVDIFNTQNKYNIIYADPAWSYKNWSVKGAKWSSAINHYALMDKKTIQQLPIPAIADKDCILFLWVTFPCLEEGLELIKAWGFRYKTCGFCWIKQNKISDGLYVGMGYWTRANAEICLIATKGKIKRINKSVRQVIMSRIREHSRKPDEARQRIVDLVGDLPRIELFARQQFPGWDCWGNEINETEGEKI